MADFKTPKSNAEALDPFAAIDATNSLSQAIQDLTDFYEGFSAPAAAVVAKKE